MMNYLKKSKILFLLSILLTLYGCEKKELTELLPATQEGKNTFGCLINGKLFVPRGREYGGNPTLFIYGEEWNLQLSVTSSSNSSGMKVKEYLDFNINGINKEGVYKLELQEYNDNNLYSPIVYSKVINDRVSCSFSRTNHDISGTLTITKINRVPRNFFVSGTFEFVLTMRKPGFCDLITLNVTQGRFDIQTY
jgi:hypothetical protein